MLSTTLKRSRGLQLRGFGAIGFARYSPDTASRAWFRGHLEHKFESLIAIAGNGARDPRHALRPTFPGCRHFARPGHSQRSGRQATVRQQEPLWRSPNMNFTAHRTCSIVGEGQSEKRSGSASVPLGEFVKAKAYVLIGEPGAGKTTALKAEQEAHGGVYLSVRDFLAFDDKPEWRGTTIYLDGLDEVRAGEFDGRPPLDQLRAKLDRLECPPFRLSCRWADWLGAYDRRRLDRVSGGALTVLQLDPLSEQDINRMLAENHGIEDPKGFIAGARKRRVASVLTNPQNLDLLATAVSGGNWPGSLLETFEYACRMLVTEPNIEHSVVRPAAGATESLLEEASRLCALQILAGLAGFTQLQLDQVIVTPDYPPVPAGAIGSDVSRVLRTRLFAGTSEGRLIPAHRQIAEFLAARRVSGLIDEGLPLQRVLALISGFDGELMVPFRNFVAWLGVHNRSSRMRLCRLNPSGLFYVGGKDTFSGEERNIARFASPARDDRSRPAWAAGSASACLSHGRVHGTSGILSGFHRGRGGEAPRERSA